MYFLLVSLFYISAAQLSVKGVSEKGFVIHFDQIEKLHGQRVYWIAHTPQETLSVKELINGVSSLGEGCNGMVTQKQLRHRPKFEVQCKLQFGKPYTLEAVVTKSGADSQILTTDFDFSNQRRRLLNMPSMAPVTSAPTTSPHASSIPSRAPVTRAPTSDGHVINPSAAPTVTASPSSAPSLTVSSAPSVIATSSTTTEATIPITSTSLIHNDNDDGGATFAGFDLSSGGGVSLFIFAILLLLIALALILGGPYLYRRYYEIFGAKNITADASPKAAAKLSEIWEETIKTPTGKLSDLSKTKLASSFGSDSKIEIAPVKSEDKIRLSEPVE